MPTFRYQALNAEQQLFTGELAADTVTQAISQLEAEGLTIQSIGFATSESRAIPTGTPRTRPAAESFSSTERSKLISREQAVLRSHLATVLEQGKVITQALRAYAEEMPAGLRRIQLKTVCDVFDRGDVSIAENALQKLPEYWIPLLSAAASSRDPGRVLRDFLEESQEADQLRRQWWLVFAYPLFIGGVALIVLTALSFIVVPVFRNIFNEFDLVLPGITRMLLTFADWITSGWLFAVMLLLLAIGAILFVARRQLSGGIFARLADRFGWPFIRSNAVARFARFIADLLEAGMPVPDALRIAGFSARTARLRQNAWRLADDLELGALPTLPARTPLSATVVHALCADMPTPTRIRLLREISNCHAERAYGRLSWTRGIIEPITICVVGILVGGVVVALYMPLIKLVEGLSG